MRPKHIVLVGGGHAHTVVLKACKDWPHSVTLIDPGTHWYSGRITQVLAGIDEPAASQIALEQFHRPGRARLIAQRVTGLDLPSQAVIGEDGQRFDFDVLSLNLGSEIRPTGNLKPDGNRVFGVKPLSDLVAMRHEIERRARSERRITVAVLGAGPSGVECSFALAELGRRLGVTLPIYLVTRPEKAGDYDIRDASTWPLYRQLERELLRRDITICEANVTGEGVNGGLLWDAETARNTPPLRPDLILLASGLKPPQIVQRLGLPTTAAGRLACDHYLNVTGHPNVFAAGDCMDLEDHPLPQNGVAAVRQGQILVRNLLAAADGRELCRYQPQKRYLQLLMVDSKRAHLAYGRRQVTARWPMWLKRWIDGRWLRG